MKFLQGVHLTAIKNDKKTSIRGIVILNDDGEMNLKNFQEDFEDWDIYA